MDCPERRICVQREFTAPPKERDSLRGYAQHMETEQRACIDQRENESACWDLVWEVLDRKEMDDIVIFLYYLGVIPFMTATTHSGLEDSTLLKISGSCCDRRQTIF